MRLLAIETSCDETSVAVLSQGRLLSNVVASQVRLHAEYGGVVPELATREHLRNVHAVARTALSEAGLGPGDLDAVAATQGPGLPQALMIGLRAGQAMAYALGRPFLGVHHHEAHLYSPWITRGPEGIVSEVGALRPNVSLIVSGGHTILVRVDGPLQHRVLGSTLDDAAGECFDKTAKLLGLPYPGGPWVDRLGAEGNPMAHAFPRPLLDDPGDDFSFSGLKTSVRTFLQRRPDVAGSPGGLRDLCASVQAAIVEVLVSKLLRAARKAGVGWVTASGGVTCNRAFRAALQREASTAGLGVRLAEPALCTDNAGMVAVLAALRLSRGEHTPLDEEIRPGWDLSETERPEATGD